MMPGLVKTDDVRSGKKAKVRHGWYDLHRSQRVKCKYLCTYLYTIARDHKLTDILVKMYNRRETTESHILSLLPPKRRHIYSGKVQIYWIKNTFKHKKVLYSP